MLFLGREPIAIAGVISIAINLALTFGLQLTVEQVSLVNALVVAVLALLVRANVTPTGAAQLKEGTLVEVITPDGEPNTTVTV